MTLKKQVQFSGSIEWIDAFNNDEYDRTAQKVATLSYRDMYELMVLKSQWRQESEMHERSDNHVETKDNCSLSGRDKVTEEDTNIGDASD